MLSIITAIFNQRALNVLFHEYLVKYTYNPFELIIIDNHSTDGSREFFKSVGAIVIENDGNYSYPFCQNQGLRVAHHDILAFLNNDIIVSPNWDKHILEVMRVQNLQVVTCCGIERLEDDCQTHLYKRKWKLIKNVIGCLGHNNFTFKWMFRLMYGNWERFAESRWREFGTSTREGFVGNTVVMKRDVLDKIGRWDERVNAGDFDLYMRTKERFFNCGDVKPSHIALGVFNHHYIRMTLNKTHPKFKDLDNPVSLKEKWGAQKLEKYLKDLHA